MTWFRVDDNLHAHKKAMRAGTEAMGLWLLAGSWAANQLTDGWVPQYAIPRWSPIADELAGRLVAAGLWIEGEHDGDKGWWFHEWGERQPTRADVTARRRADADRRKAWRDSRRAKSSLGDSLNDASLSDSLSDPFSDTEGESGRDGDVTQPDLGFSVIAGGLTGETSLSDSRRESQVESVLPGPARPGPGSTYVEPKREAATRKRAAHPLPAGWKPNEKHAELARERGLNLDNEAAKFIAHAEANDRRQVRWDAAFRQWLLNSRANRYATTGGGSHRADPVNGVYWEQ